MGTASKTGKVFLVGAGPGNPDLMTVRAHKLVSEAEAVVYDRLVSKEILDLIPDSADRVYVGKAPNNHHMPQDKINLLLCDLASAGKNVVRLKGGDPFTFGRGGEEALELVSRGIEVEVIPGITTASGVSAAIGLPLTHRGAATGVRFITGSCRGDSEPDLDWKGLADPNTTLVVYMGLAPLDLIVTRLMEHGTDPTMPAALIENATRPEQRLVVSKVGDLAASAESNDFKPPTLIVIGHVVSLVEAMGINETNSTCDVINVAFGAE